MLNESTDPHSPPEAMQFGGALLRVLYLIRHADPKFGPTKASKHDVTDGFYCMFLRAQDLLRLAIVLPRYEGEPQLIGIPMSTTMGWTQSPPTFSTMSETACDLANRLIREHRLRVEPHRLEELAAPMDDTSPDPAP